MSLVVTSIASGSSGNAMLLQTPEAAVLVDCGLAQRTIERELRHMGVDPCTLAGILITHEHGDHCHSALSFARRHNLQLILNQATANALGALSAGVAHTILPTGQSMNLAGMQIRSFRVAHDAAEPVGYCIRAANWCVGVAIDLGSWDTTVLEALIDADLIVLEANHDRERLRAAPYTSNVKQRIYSSLGHLDNVEAGKLLAHIGSDGRRRTVWLAHLSEQSNSPKLAVDIVNNILSLANINSMSVHALPRRAPLVWESQQHSQQMSMFSFEF